MMKRRHACVVLFLLCATLGGCLERTETIRIAPDGSVAVTHLIKGHPGDLENGGAWLPDAGFESRRWQKKNGSGEIEAFLEARATFASVRDIPTSFAPVDAPHRRVALQFDTDVAITEEDRGTVYRFTRTYRARRWADYAEFRRRAFSRELRKLLDSDDLDLDVLSEETVRELVKGLVDYERFKVERWAEHGIAAAGADVTGAAVMRVTLHTSLVQWFARNVSIDALLRLIEAENPDLDDETGRIHREVEAFVVAEVARGLGLDENTRRRVAHAYAEERASFEITEDLHDESFVVRVKLPGTILGHNGARLEDGCLTWRFDGESLRDREVRLEAVSVIKP